MSKGTKILGLRLAPFEREALERIATRERKVLSDVTRAAVVEYLERHGNGTAEEQHATPAPKPKKPRRPPSKPARLANLAREAQALLDEYSAWQENLPDFAEGSDMAEKLSETVEALEQAVELLEGIDPPRGFGRD